MKKNPSSNKPLNCHVIHTHDECMQTSDRSSICYCAFPEKKKRQQADNTTLAKSRPMSNLLTHNCHIQQIEEKLALIWNCVRAHLVYAKFNCRSIVRSQTREYDSKCSTMLICLPAIWCRADKLQLWSELLCSKQLPAAAAGNNADETAHCESITTLTTFFFWILFFWIPPSTCLICAVRASPSYDQQGY